MRDVALDKITEYAAEDADITLQLKQIFAPLLKKERSRESICGSERTLGESAHRYGV